jgi:hypothetical protein
MHGSLAIRWSRASSARPQATVSEVTNREKIHARSVQIWEQNFVKQPRISAIGRTLGHA